MISLMIAAGTPVVADESGTYGPGLAADSLRLEHPAHPTWAVG